MPPKVIKVLTDLNKNRVQSAPEIIPISEVTPNSEFIPITNLTNTNIDEIKPLNDELHSNKEKSVIIEEKKRPGRPKKTNINVQVKIEGIKKEPADPDDEIEFVHQNTKIFKKFLTMFKSYGAREILFEFTKTQVKMSIESHTRKLESFCYFNCDYVTHYYCANNHSFTVNLSMFEDIFRNIDKPHYKLTIKMTKAQMSTMYVIIRDYELDANTIHEISVTRANPNIRRTIPNIQLSYPLKFTFPSKSFKTLISDSSIREKKNKMSIFSFRKNGDAPLEVVYDGVINQNKHDTNTSYNNERLNMRYTPDKPDKVMSVAVDSEEVKTFSSLTVGEQINIYLDDRQASCYETMTDEVKITNNGKTSSHTSCTIQIFVNIPKL